LMLESLASRDGLATVRGGKVCHWRWRRGWFCVCLCEFDVGVSCLPLLATVRGGTSFLFPTAKKKRSKENAYRR
jgi:hypothetical protein